MHPPTHKIYERAWDKQKYPSLSIYSYLIIPRVSKQTGVRKIIERVVLSVRVQRLGKPFGCGIRKLSTFVSLLVCLQPAVPPPDTGITLEQLKENDVEIFGP